MNAETAFKMVEHYSKLDNCRNVVPVKVTITYKRKTEVFFGMRYTAVGHYTADMMACTHNGVNPGTEYTNERFELLGKPPSSYKRKVRVGPHWEQKVVYRIPGDDRDWYISGHMQGPIPDQVKEYHPFGENFGLGQWTHGRIDEYDNEPGKREHLPITVEVLTPAEVA